MFKFFDFKILHRTGAFFSQNSKYFFSEKMDSRLSICILEDTFSNKFLSDFDTTPPYNLRESKNVVPLYGMPLTISALVMGGLLPVVLPLSGQILTGYSKKRLIGVNGCMLVRCAAVGGGSDRGGISE